MKKLFNELLLEGAREINVPLTRDVAELFEIYMAELERWNKKINITGVRGELEIVVKHFIDSLSPLKYIYPNSSVLDIGAGGGFPGIPLKIADRTIKVTLMEATLKKVNFQKHIIRTLNLSDIKAIHGRAEDRIRQENRETEFDVVISRAFSAMGRFLKIAILHVKSHGRIIAMRGKEAIKEIDDIANTVDDLGLELQDVREFHLPFLRERRSIVVFGRRAGESS